MNRILTTFLLLVLIATTLQAQDRRAHMFFYAHGEQFTWEETRDGRTLLTEQGPLYAFGIGGWLGSANGWETELKGELLTGTVAYEGETQSGANHIPYDCDTSYGGFKGEGIVGYCITQGQPLRVIPHIGLSWRFWNRQLDWQEDESGPYGYGQKWNVLQGIAGVTARLALAAKQELFVRGQYRVGINNTEEVDMSNVGGPTDITLKPGTAGSLYGTAGIRFDHFQACLFYETLAFKESPLDETYGHYLQPEAAATAVGIELRLIL